MTLIKKYGYIATPFLYWLIYLTARVLHSGSGWMNDAEFTESLRHDLVFITVSLVFYSVGCFFVAEKVECLIFILSGALFLHFAAFIFALLVFLWNGQFLWAEMMDYQKLVSLMMLGVPVLVTVFCRELY